MKVLNKAIKEGMVNTELRSDASGERKGDAIAERCFSLLQVFSLLFSFKHHKHILYTLWYVRHILQLKKLKKE